MEQQNLVPRVSSQGEALNPQDYCQPTPQEQHSIIDTIHDYEDGESMNQSMNMSINEESPRKHFMRPESNDNFEENKSRPQQVNDGWNIIVPPKKTVVKDELCLFECKCKERLYEDSAIQKHASSCYEMFQKYGAFIQQFVNLK